MKKKFILIMSSLALVTCVVGGSLIAFSYTKRNTFVDNQEQQEEKKEEETTKPQEEEKHEEEKHEEEKHEEEIKPKEEECKHDWSDFIINKDSTCSSEGLKTRSCKLCLKTQSEIIPVNDSAHDYGEAIITKRATCQEEGEAVHYCIHNSEHVLKETIDKIPHVYSDKVNQVDPTYRKDGIKAHYHCLICDQYFDLDMTTILSKQDLVIPKLDSTNIDKLESKISLLDSLSSDFKEYHEDYINSLYDQYELLNQNEKDFLSLEKYKDSNISFKEKLDSLKNSFDSKYSDLTKIYDSKNNSITLFKSNGVTECSTLSSDEYGITNQFVINGYSGDLSFYLKPDATYNDYIKKDAKIYIYSPVDCDVKLLNSTDNEIINTYNLKKDCINLVSFDSDTLSKLCNSYYDNKFIFKFENINTTESLKFNFSSIYTNTYNPEELINEVDNDLLNYAFSESIINKYLNLINGCSEEFKNNATTKYCVEKLNEAKNQNSKKYSLYHSPSDMTNYNTKKRKNEKVETINDPIFGVGYKFSVSQLNKNTELSTVLDFKPYAVTSNKGIEFYIKGNFSSFSEIFITNPITCNKINCEASLISPNILKVFIDKDTTYSFISEYDISDKNITIYIIGLKVEDYVVSQFYFSDYQY